MKPTIDALRQKLQQLQDLHDSGALATDAYAEARGPLERELVDAVMKNPSSNGPMAQASSPTSSAAAPASEAIQSTSNPPAAARPSRRLQAGVVIGVLALAAVGYSVTGSPGRAGLGSAPAAVDTAANAGAVDGGPAVTPEQVAEIVDRVAQRLKEKPDDPAGWALLARAYASMGRYTDAAPAYQKALALGGENATLMADYADVLAAQNDGKLGGEALKLVERALVLEPDNFKALALSGSAAFDNRDYAAAVRQWEKVERKLPTDSPFLEQVRASVARARELGGLPAVAVAAASAPPAAQQAAASSASAVASAQATAVSGSVSLAPGLAAKVSPSDTVFILARAADGPRMPLAVLRKQVKDLPLNFKLDDSMAMAPTAKISDFAQIVVSARVSKSGEALPQAGDLAGQSAPVAPGQSGIVIQIADVVGSK